MTFKKTAATAALLVTAATASGCYGQFALTRALYDWNGRATPNKVANSALTWAMILIPVYAVAGVVDFLVLNTIEFWSGTNPVVSQRDGSVVVERGGHRYTYRQVGGVVEVDRDGAPSIRYFRRGERVIIQDGAGRTLKEVPAEALAQAARTGRSL